MSCRHPGQVLWPDCSRITGDPETDLVRSPAQSGLIEVAQVSAMGQYAEGKTVDVFSEMFDEVAIG